MVREMKELAVDLSSNRKMNPRKSSRLTVVVSLCHGKGVRVPICKVSLYEANWAQSFA